MYHHMYTNQTVKLKPSRCTNLEAEPGQRITTFDTAVFVTFTFTARTLPVLPVFGPDQWLAGSFRNRRMHGYGLVRHHALFVSCLV